MKDTMSNSGVDSCRTSNTVENLKEAVIQKLGVDIKAPEPKKGPAPNERIFELPLLNTYNNT